MPSGNLEKPEAMRVGATTFYFKPTCVKALFADRPEVVDVPLEGEGWSFIKAKRLHMLNVPKSEDCLKPDPNDALEAALHL